jgi:hypothetical protein
MTTQVPATTENSNTDYDRLRAEHAIERADHKIAEEHLMALGFPCVRALCSCGWKEKGARWQGVRL